MRNQAKIGPKVTLEPCMPVKPIENETVDAAVRAALAARLTPQSTRKEASRLAASVLFLDHGVYPSAKVVREFTQQGSLTDINRDLQEFWRDLRDKARVQIDAPGLPDELLGRFGEALREIWTLATAKAGEDLEAMRQEAESQVRDALVHLVQAKEARTAAEERIQAVEQDLREERERREAAQTRAEVQHAEIEALTQALDTWRRRHADEAGARKEAEERFSRDLGAERDERLREAQRFQGEVNFAKQQIEAARAAERVAREHLGQMKASLEVELTSYRQRLGRAEEAHSAAKLEVAELTGDNRALTSRVAELQERLTEMAKALAKRASSPPKSPLKRRSLR